MCVLEPMHVTEVRERERQRQREREREVGPPTQQSFERDVVVVAAVGYVRR